METEELELDLRKLGNNVKYMSFEELISQTKGLLNNFALKTHNQSTFIVDDNSNFLGEVFSKEDESFFVSINRRHNKTAIIIYSLMK